MEWLGRRLYPKARPHERRSRMQMMYLLVFVILLITVAVAGLLWFLNRPPLS